MNVFLLCKDSDFDLSEISDIEKEPIEKDLGLNNIFSAMADGDEIILNTSMKVIFRFLTDAEDISYRQEILRDVISNEKALRKLYDISKEAILATKKEDYWLTSSILTTRFSSAVATLENFMPYLKMLRSFAEKEGKLFKAKGFVRLFESIKKELDDDFLSEADEVLSELKFRDGTLIGLSFDSDVKLFGYELLRKNKEESKLKWKMAPKFTLSVNDEAGAEDVSERMNMALDKSVDTLTFAAKNVRDFLMRLRDELAFYVGVLNLCEHFKKKNIDYCMPSFCEEVYKQRRIYGLSDASLALSIEETVSNDLDTDGKLLYIITGANQGGKSTFLRSIGQAQIMAQAGMIVCAKEYKSHIVSGVFTHFSKLEDRTMKSGKFDEELKRMSGISDRIKPGSLILFNESFQSTNEREGSEICREITEALIENNIEVFFVTHFYAFAETVMNKKSGDTVFLRANRLEDGKRTYKIISGLPQQTAFGRDLYEKVFNK